MVAIETNIAKSWSVQLDIHQQQQIGKISYCAYLGCEVDFF
jgi:hypothetical protein